MEKDGCGSQGSAGQRCPALSGIGEGEEAKQLVASSDGAAAEEVTAEERAVIRRFLEEPDGSGDGRTRILARAALKFAAVLLVAAGVSMGLGDGDEFDEAGCSVALRPGGPSHDAGSAEAQGHPGDRQPDSEAGAGSGAGGGTGGRPECEVRAERCADRMGAGICRVSNQRCRLIRAQREECRVQNEEERYALLEAMLRVERKVEAVGVAVAGRGEVVAPVSESEAKRVFVLMKRLEGGPKQRKAPLAAVFRMTVLEGHSQAKAARLCGCVPALISRRVKTIESRFGMSIERLRSFASVLLEMEASVKGDRVRKRRNGAAADGTGDGDEYEDGAERAELVEDAYGYLPEEREDCGY
jgi:hypothetical protein